ncbi:hypothetical protein CFP56_006116 [Quercus suber]|uniref:Uncharacterized protein n=1 Tax=Quercus suber TaxID=58331 RepID=A0AAW0L8W3_QUESU
MSVKPTHPKWDSCQVEKMFLTSWPTNNDDQNISCTDVHNELHMVLSFHGSKVVVSSMARTIFNASASLLKDRSSIETESLCWGYCHRMKGHSDDCSHTTVHTLSPRSFLGRSTIGKESLCWGYCHRNKNGHREVYCNKLEGLIEQEQ